VKKVEMNTQNLQMQHEMQHEQIKTLENQGF
jgi:hypothetical protein